MKKKITFLISSLAGGGTEGVCVNIANGLSQRGWIVDLLVLNCKDEVYTNRLRKEVNLIVLDVNNARYSLIPILKYLIKYKPQKILVFNYELAIILVLLKKCFSLKISIIARNMNAFSKNIDKNSMKWNDKIINAVIIKLYCKVDYVINQCIGMRDDLLNVYPELKYKTNFIYNPVSEVIENNDIIYEISDDAPEEYLLCVGRLEEQKAVHYAIEALSELLLSYPMLRLKIVGQGSLECELKKLTVDLNIENRVDFEGFQKNIVPYYLNARATLLTSLYEGFPNVLVESITIGTPVISFNCTSGPSEIIQNGVNGYLVDDFKTKQLIEACKKTLETNWSKEEIIKSSKQYRLDDVINRYELCLSNVN